MKNFLLQEKAIIISLLSLIIITPLEHNILSHPIANTLILAIVFIVIMYSALNVAHHAEVLAEKYGEPYGTMILTLSAVLVEVLIIGIMMSHSNNINLARDTIVSAIILDINGLLGIAAIIGGIKHGVQDYNINSTNSFISMVIVAIGISMVMPIFIDPQWLNAYLTFLSFLFVLMFIIFTRVQIKEHRYFFKYSYKSKERQQLLEQHTDVNSINGIYHTTMLIAAIILIGFLSELLSVFMNQFLTSSGFPIALGALAVAIISASPELITAIKSAHDNRMQTVINIALGASLATVLLTIPAMIALSLFTHHTINFSLSPIQIVLLAITFWVSVIHFNDGKSNVLEGAIHFIIFIVFLFFMFTGQI